MGFFTRRRFVIKVHILWKDAPYTWLSLILHSRYFLFHSWSLKKKPNIYANLHTYNPDLGKDVEYLHWSVPQLPINIVSFFLLCDLKFAFKRSFWWFNRAKHFFLFKWKFRAKCGRILIWDFHKTLSFFTHFMNEIVTYYISLNKLR